MSENENGFQDPLENYDPPIYNDSLERALAEVSVSVMQSSPVISISPDTTIKDAIDHLNAQDVACELVVEDGKLVGLFSVRDVLNNVAEDFDTKKDLPVRDVMTQNPIFAFESDPSGAVLSVMAARGYRHVPVLDTQENVAGIVSPQRVMDFLLDHLVEQ